MVEFMKETVIKDLERFAVGLEESYELDKAEVLVNEKETTVDIGYVITEGSYKFKIVVEYKLLEDGRYQLPQNLDWTIVQILHNGEEKVIEDKYKTLGHVMDKVHSIMND